MSEPTAGTAGAHPNDSRTSHAPRHVRAFSPILQALLRAGVPMLFNGLITIRGRKSGQPRTTGLAIIQTQGRRFVWAPWGEVNWVQNLRAAGEAMIEYRRKRERVRATELDEAQRLAYFRDILAPLARSMPLGVTFIRVMDGVDLRKPDEAAQGRVVFELTSVSQV